ncbi:MAG: magnesium/cobalt transporter CorA [Candidatus Thorarchaeota archaeon]|nr:magnesium/cobalt transporter CorA [Candidatus Thorarchaeota archaeon]
MNRSDPASTDETTTRTRIQILDYFEDGSRRAGEAQPQECVPPPPEVRVRWIHVTGVHDASMVENVCQPFQIHPLIVEDIVRRDQRPKLDILDNGVYVVLRAFAVAKGTPELIRSEQVSVLILDRTVVSFEEVEPQVFELIARRMAGARPSAKTVSSDMLAHTILDLIVDGYFVALESLGDEIELLEDTIVETAASQEVLGRVYELKRAVMDMRRHVWPLREAVLKLNHAEIPLVKESSSLYFRDLYGNIIETVDMLEIYREAISGLMDIYLSAVSNRLNEVMKVLTVISTIFIPMTLLASIYGMNFEYMPELHWPYSYPILLALMLSLGIALLVLFRKRGWV